MQEIKLDSVDSQVQYKSIQKCKTEMWAIRNYNFTKVSNIK